MVRLDFKSNFLRSCLIELHINVLHVLHTLQFSCIITRQVPSTMYVTHATKQSFSNPKITLYFIAVNYLVIQSVRSLLEPFLAYFHVMFSKPYVLTLTAAQDCIHKRPVVMANIHPLPRWLCSEHSHSSIWISD